MFGRAVISRGDRKAWLDRRFETTHVEVRLKIFAAPLAALNPRLHVASVSRISDVLSFDGPQPTPGSLSALNWT